MILDIFKYYAQFPRIEGVRDIFANGRSDNPGYAELLSDIEHLPSHSRLPGIGSYVFGQSFDAVKARVDSLRGTYLMVEPGGGTSERDQRNSIQDTFQIAVTVAVKVKSGDLAEQAILMDATLRLMNQLRVYMMKDQEAHPWLKEISNRNTMEPFSSPTFSSIGWALFYNREGADMFGLKDEMRML